MTLSNRADSREEALRVWAGGLLIGTGEHRDPPDGDPERVAGFCRLHGIEPLLAGAPGARASPWRRDDGDPIKRCVAAEMVRQQEFVSVLRTLQSEAALKPIICKGQALAHAIYPQPWLRPRTDIDALVERGSFEAMAGVLATLGYQRAGSFDADLVMPQLAFFKRAHGICHVWDVHRRLSNRPALAGALEYAGLRQSVMEFRVDDVTFLAPDRVNSLLIACLHLIGHHANDIRLIWLYDIHLLAASLDTGELRQFLSKAMAGRQVQAACHAALQLTQRYIPAQHTDELRHELDPGPGARWPSEQTYLTGLMADAGAIGRGNLLRFLAQHVFPSPDYMVKRFGIRHRWQLPFWYAIRIGRALPKLFRRR